MVSKKVDGSSAPATGVTRAFNYFNEKSPLGSGLSNQGIRDGRERGRERRREKVKRGKKKEERRSKEETRRKK